MLVAGGVFPASNIALFPGSTISPYSKLAAARRRSPSRRSTPNSLPAMLSVATAHEPRLADQLRLGGLAEDGLSYKEKFIVRSYEVGENKTVRMQGIANLLQDAACNHFLSVGFSTDDGFSTTHSMKKLNLILVLSRIHFEIYKYPAWNEVVEIEAWLQMEGRIGFRRDFIITDYSTGRIIGRATSKWLLMNQETRRFHQLVDDIRDEVQPYTLRSPRSAFPDENKMWLKKIEKLNFPPQYFKLGLEPRRSDLDMNRHLNMATYIGLILESMPSDINDKYELKSLTVDYKRECGHGDAVDSLTSRESNGAGSDDDDRRVNINGDDNYVLQFRHSLRLSRDGSETNRGRTIWRKKHEI